jgi:hypothetical protein
MSTDEKAKYTAMADEAAEEHRRQHPDWKFSRDTQKKKMLRKKAEELNAQKRQKELAEKNLLVRSCSVLASSGTRSRFSFCIVKGDGAPGIFCRTPEDSPYHHFGPCFVHI